MGPWSPELLAAGTVPTLGRLWDTAVDTVSELMPQDMQACHPKDKGPRNLPHPPPVSSTLPVSPPPSHSGGRGRCSLRVSTAAPVCLPTRDRQPSALAQAPPILPGAAAARGACRPSRLHSGTRRWLDTDVNPAGRANSGHPQRQLRAQAAHWEILAGCCQVPRALSIPPVPTPSGLSASASVFFCLPCPPLSLERPAVR